VHQDSKVQYLCLFPLQQAFSKQLQETIKEIMAIERENEINLRKPEGGLGEKVEEIGRGKKTLNGFKNKTRKAPKLFHGAV
jgi:hypothetical protein